MSAALNDEARPLPGAPFKVDQSAAGIVTTGSAGSNCRVRNLWIATGKGDLGKLRQQKQTTWAAYIDWLRKQYTTLPVTTERYGALDNDNKAALKRDLAFSLGAKYRGSARKGADLELRDTIAFDLDKLEPAVYEAVLAAAKSLRYAFLHVGSASNAVNGKRSGRLIFPVSRRIAEKLNIEAVDPVSHQKNQICYVPARCSDASEVFEKHNGAWLDADATLAEYADFRAPAQWPRTSREQSVFSETSRLDDPRDRPGLIGAFCRKYDFREAIETFGLPYSPTADEHRWTPTDARSSGGARIYGHPADTGAFSWMYNSHDHGLSPKKNINAYDAVRLHRFGELDRGLLGETPVTELPSTHAMKKFVRAEHPDVVADAGVKTNFGPIDDEAVDGVAAPAGSAQSAKSAEQPKAGTRARRFAPIPVDEFSDGPEPEWIIDGILPQAELAVMYGESGCGKTFFVTDQVLAVARGVPWQGRATKQGKVAYIAGESPGGLRKRFKAYAQHNSLELAELRDSMFLVGNAPDLLKADDVSELCNELRGLGTLAIVVIDTLARATPGANENSAEDMGRALKHCQAIYRLTGALVILIHHSGKDQSRGARGWSGIRAATDCEIEITSFGLRRLARVSKQRDGEDNLQFEFELMSVAYGRDASGRELSSLVVKPVSSSAGSTRPPTSLKQRAVWQTLREAGGSLPLSHLMVRAKENLPCGKPDRRVQYIRKAIEALSASGKVVVAGDSVTLVGVAVATNFEPIPPDAVEQPSQLTGAASSPRSRVRKARKRAAEPATAADTTPEANAEASASPDVAETPAPAADTAPPPERAEASRPEESPGKSNGAADTSREMFMKRLDVGSEVADILVRERFSTVEEILDAPVSRLNKIPEFDKDLVAALLVRARGACAQQ
jgi:hypothetical protein